MTCSRIFIEYWRARDENGGGGGGGGGGERENIIIYINMGVFYYNL